MRYLPALILDAVFVLVFAVIGRASHDEDAAGFLLTAWPFLAALVVGHLVAALLPTRPRRPWSAAWGAVVWVVTVIGGMLLRVASGATAQVAFIVVATLVLGVFLVGWRLVAALVRRRRATDRGIASAGEEEAETRASETGASDDGAAEDDSPEAEAEGADAEGGDVEARPSSSRGSDVRD